MEIISINDNATDALRKINDNFDSCSTGPAPATIPVEAVEGQDVFLGYMVEDGNWVRQTDKTNVVDYGITYTFHLPEGIVARVKSGSNYFNQDLTESGNLFDGDTLTFPQSHNTQVISFAKYTNGAVAKLTLQEYEEFVAAGDIHVTFADKDVVAHNADKEAALAVLSKASFNENNYPDSRFYYKRVPMIAHVSDLHGDAQRAYNVMRYAKHYGLDDVIVSGDSVHFDFNCGCGFVFAAAEKAGVHVCQGIGNHEVFNLPSGKTSFNLIADHVEDFGYMKSSGVITDKFYYYHDISGKNLRIIALDTYEGGTISGSMTSAQLEWFFNTLKSTPSGYGVVVVMHAPEGQMQNTGSVFSKFRTTTPATGNDGDNCIYPSTGRLNVGNASPISTIIDAFIQRSSFTLSYTDNLGSQSFSGSFASGVNDGVEFICFLNGHVHLDNMGYVGDSPRKLNINITCGNGHVQMMNESNHFTVSGYDDIPRRGTGVTQDAFNVYAIDREHKQVRVLRIGSDTKIDFSKRDWLIVDYGERFTVSKPTSSYINISKVGGDAEVRSYAFRYQRLQWLVAPTSGHSLSAAPTATMAGGGSISVTATDGGYLISTDSVTGNITISASAS